MGSYVQAYTLYSSVRPFGITAIIGGWDSELEVPVDAQVGSGPSSGSGGNSLEEGVKEAARIIYVAHEDSKDKEFELEMTWISKVDGPTKGRHEEVPKEMLEEAERLAKKALEGDDDEMEE